MKKELSASLIFALCSCKAVTAHVKDAVSPSNAVLASGYDPITGDFFDSCIEKNIMGQVQSFTKSFDEKLQYGQRNAFGALIFDENIVILNPTVADLARPQVNGRSSSMTSIVSKMSTWLSAGLDTGPNSANGGLPDESFRFLAASSQGSDPDFKKFFDTGADPLSTYALVDVKWISHANGYRADQLASFRKDLPATDTSDNVRKITKQCGTHVFNRDLIGGRYLALIEIKKKFDPAASIPPEYKSKIDWLKSEEKASGRPAAIRRVVFGGDDQRYSVSNLDDVVANIDAWKTTVRDRTAKVAVGFIKYPSIPDASDTQLASETAIWNARIDLHFLKSYIVAMNNILQTPATYQKTGGAAVAPEDLSKISSRMGDIELLTQRYRDKLAACEVTRFLPEISTECENIRLYVQAKESQDLLAEAKNFIAGYTRLTVAAK